MGQNRLTDLALLSVEREMLENINFDAIIDKFAAAKPEKLIFCRLHYCNYDLPHVLRRFKCIHVIYTYKAEFVVVSGKSPLVGYVGHIGKDQ